MTNQISVSRAKGPEKQSLIITPELVLNKTEDFNNIVVMSGTATRKPLEKRENRPVRTTQKTDFKSSFSKLRAPFCKSHHKHAPMEERLMTKSCEVLFECIKPYKDIRVARKSQTNESVRTFGSILTTDIIYERKATRKVQFFSFSQENSVLTNKGSQVPTPEFDTEKFEVENWGLNGLLPPDVSNLIAMTPSNAVTNRTVKAVSSEDFITNAFPEPASI